MERCRLGRACQKVAACKAASLQPARHGISRKGLSASLFHCNGISSGESLCRSFRPRSSAHRRLCRTRAHAEHVATSPTAFSRAQGRPTRWRFPLFGRPVRLSPPHRASRADVFGFPRNNPQLPFDDEFDRSMHLVPGVGRRMRRFGNSSIGGNLIGKMPCSFGDSAGRLSGSGRGHIRLCELRIPPQPAPQRTLISTDACAKAQRWSPLEVEAMSCLSPIMGCCV